MSGHSKWSNIKHRKGAQDALKGKVFGQLAKHIRIAVRQGGSGDPAANPTLRLILEKARAANMPKENVQRAIDRGLGKSGSGPVQEVVYEGYGPGGVGILVAAATDNANRTSGELRFIFSRAGGSLGAPGSVMYMFKRVEANADGEDSGYICTIPMPVTNLEQQQKLQDLIDELLDNDDVEEVFCAGQWEGSETN